MGEIVLARVDDRLIHGQVMTSWLNYLSANKIIIVDEIVAGDMLMMTVLKSVIPANIKLDVCSTADGIEALNNLGMNDKVILLVKFPEILEDLIDGGVPIKTINVGGMGSKPGRKTLYKWIAVSEEERECYKRLIVKGIDVGIQVIAEDKRLKISKYL